MRAVVTAGHRKAANPKSWSERCTLRRRRLDRQGSRDYFSLHHYVRRNHLANILLVRPRMAKEPHCIVAAVAVSARQTEGMTWREVK